jgi:hypothetical protein
MIISLAQHSLNFELLYSFHLLDIVLIIKRINSLQ